MASVEEVLQYWFGNAPGAAASRERTRFWFAGGEAVDREIRQRFGDLVEDAAAGDLDPWRQSDRGTLALIILLDQFPRNIHRGSALAYACDARALQLALDGMAAGQDRSLTTVERAFFYLPLEHAEDLEIQRKSVRAFEELLAEAPAALRPLCEGFLDYAWKHLRVIERFARFPHRNAALGRPSSAEEEEFLRQPGSSF
ncbi:membrane protein [Desulfuromonas versatilis]|uniref:Membrane protein n=1 Tax=Desulfuromonas versatilis TaxID=2802975 RepID=A0ABM8HT12_9BACT|nr:DUF924 family protein [Desulfuromonas versatilis]BCR03825.1 membrane protein [Desulfuromonas versatilis]